MPIPSNRLANWSAGVTVGVIGGIPTNRTNIVDITKSPYFADNTGATDCSSIITTAINAANPGDIIYLPAGTYLVNEPIIPNLGKSNYTIRGAGDTTIIKWMGTYGELFYIGNASDYNWSYPAGGVAITGGLTQGSTVLTVASTSAVIDGGIIQISEANDTTLPVIHVSGYNSSRTQKARVVSHTATTVTISPGLLWTLQSSLNPIFHVAQYQSNGVGVENMFIDDSNSTSPYVIYFEQCYGSWIYNVHSQLAYNFHFFLWDCLQCQVEHCYLDQLNHAGPDGAALLMQGTSATLVQNNIITKAFPHLEINFGSCGNVFAYNFCYDSLSFGSIGGSMDSNHGPHNSYNLYEGNIAPNIQCDGYFGGASEDTVFRNWLFGTCPGVSTAREPVLLQRFTRNYNVEGNLLGTLGVPYSSIDNNITGNCYSFGLPNLGNDSSSGIAQESSGIYWLDWLITGEVTSTGGAGMVGVFTTTGASGNGDITAGFTQVGLSWAGGLQSNIVVGQISGNHIIFTGNAGNVLPAIGTVAQMWPGQAGYQERDLDVQGTLYQQANYDVSHKALASGDQPLGTGVLVNSYYLSGAPSWFGSLPWPPISAVSPYTFSITGGSTSTSGLASGFAVIPAGYRFLNSGADPSGAAPPPIITSQLSVTGISGSVFTYQIVATNSPTSYLATGLPVGISGNSGIGLLTGTPTVTGISNVFIGAINGLGTGTATLTITIDPATTPIPVITSSLAATGVSGSAFTYTITATNTPTSYGATGFPAALLINTTNGVLSGYPLSTGLSNVTIEAINGGGTGSGFLALTILPVAPILTSPLAATGTSGVSFTYSITASSSPTGYSATSLPAGLLLNTAGSITGVPTVSGIYSSPISAINAGGTGTGLLVFTFNPQAPVITSETLVTGVSGVAFSYSITATNNPTGYAATNLPLNLLSNPIAGTITGYPLAVATTTGLITATNAGGVGNTVLTIVIEPASPVITSPLTAAGLSGSAFSYQITATNSPTSYGAVGLPSPLIVNTSLGSIAGTPTTSGVSHVTLQAINAEGTGSAVLVLTILGPGGKPVITSHLGTISTEMGSHFSYTITANGSPTSYNAFGLPRGLSVNTSNGVINGVPTVAGTYHVVIEAINPYGTTQASLIISVQYRPIISFVRPVVAAPGHISY